MKTLRNIYLAIFDSHLTYSCFVWTQNIITVNRLFFRWKHYKSYILKTNYFTQVHFSLKTIFYRLMIKLPSQIYFLSIEKVPPIFYYWFTFSRNMHRYETCWSVNDHLNIQTFWIQMYGCFSIRASTIYSWNSTKKIFY